MTWTWPDAAITNVVDGDTIDVRLTRDIGFHGTVQFVQRVRLARINTAKRGTERGKAARQFVIANSAGPVTVETFKPYKYGDEWMAEITLPNGANLSDTLVAEDLAVHWDGTGPRPADTLHRPT